MKIVLEPGYALEGRLRPGMSVVARVDTRTEARRGRPVRGFPGGSTADTATRESGS